MAEKVPTPLTLLVKLGALAVHTAEMLSNDCHPYDRVALRAMLADPELMAWLKVMDAESLVPKRRKVPMVPVKFARPRRRRRV